jgi:RNA polymerase sigma factor (sigma-70 family)
MTPMDLCSASDGELLASFHKTADQQAFAQIVERHHAMVLATCRRVTGSRQDAEDCAQAVLLVLADKAGGLGSINSLGAWLHQVSRNVALRARSAMQSRQRNERKAVASAVVAEDDAATEVSQELDDALAHISDRYRTPLVLHYLEGLSCAEIAALTAQRPDNIAMRLSRGRELLRRQLVKHGVPAATLAVFLAGNVACAKASAEQAAIITANLKSASPTIIALSKGIIGMSISKIICVAALAVVLSVGAASIFKNGQTIATESTSVPAVGEQNVSQFSNDNLVERIVPAWQARLEEALNQEVTLNFQDAPGLEILDEITKQTGVTFKIDPVVSALLAPPNEGHMSISVTEMSARSALDFIAKIIGKRTDFVLRDGEVLWQKAGEVLSGETLRYHIGQLIHPLSPEASWSSDDRRLVEELIEIIKVECDDDAGLPAPISFMPVEPAVDITSYFAHQKITDLLLDMRSRGAKCAAGSAELRLRAALMQTMNFSFQETSEDDFMQRISSGTGMEVRISPGVLAKGGATFTYQAKDALVGPTLKKIVQSAGLFSAVDARDRKESVRKKIEGTNDRVILYISETPVERVSLRRIYDLRLILKNTYLVYPVSVSDPLDPADLEFAVSLLNWVNREQPAANARIWNDLLIAHLDFGEFAAFERLLDRLSLTKRVQRNKMLVNSRLMDDAVILEEETDAK